MNQEQNYRAHIINESASEQVSFGFDTAQEAKNFADDVAELCKKHQISSVTGSYHKDEVCPLHRK